MPELATSGEGSALSINTGTTGTPSWVTIGEIMTFDVTGRTAGTSDVTNFNSGKYKAWIPTLIDSGVVDMKVNRAFGSSDAGQVALEAAFVGLTVTGFKFVFPISAVAGQTTVGDTLIFQALVQECGSWSVSPDKAVTAAFKLKITGAWTYTAGS